MELEKALRYVPEDPPSPMARALWAASLAGAGILFLLLVFGSFSGTAFTVVSGTLDAWGFFLASLDVLLAAALGWILKILWGMPTVEIKLHDGGGGAQSRKVRFIRARRVHLEGGLYVWRERGGARAHVAADRMWRRNIFGGWSIAGVVHRNVRGRDVYYETIELEASRVGYAQQQTQLALRRAVQAERALGGRR